MTFQQVRPSPSITRGHEDIELALSCPREVELREGLLVGKGDMEVVTPSAKVMAHMPWVLRRGIAPADHPETAECGAMAEQERHGCLLGLATFGGRDGGNQQMMTEA
jgi:hypothetical protein